MYYPMYSNGNNNSSQMYSMGMPMMYANGNGNGNSGHSGGQSYYDDMEWVCYGGSEPMYYQGRDS
jgi:hypothetical protein